AQGDDAHGEPPFGERPARPLAHARGLPDDVVGVVGSSRRGCLAEPGGQVALEAVGRAHARPPFATALPGSESVPRAPRMAARPRASLDCAVPRGTSRTSATAGTD